MKGLLSLYNAAYLGTHGETILDEAISFTRGQLMSMLSELKPPLATQVSLALETPIRRRIKRLFARHFISIYQEEPTRNDVILELAKLDFSLLQSLHREELKKICMQAFYISSLTFSSKKKKKEKEMSFTCYISSVLQNTCKNCSLLLLMFSFPIHGIF